MAEMPEEMKNLGALIAVSKIIEVFSDLVQAADKASPEIKAFVKPFENEIDKTAKALESLFGKDFLEGK
ncbi:hypothetical protein SEA_SPARKLEGODDESS_209 [Streptomyces phage SparkleGoddess]|uniref:Uncharacterized protein n=2 Tax=Gilsonvirus comrade TaxID=2846395 RepID=A0A345MEA7_9CAUD|nr:hypothetical protein SEA_SPARKLEGODDESS_209 [Streptomyces phage SparkleGoddess]QQO39862.1 hypothetical protein SEA_BELFORT_209 [Streptomyces phage Belfort]QZE11771.1 hypothetical protein SEA_KARP_205 [Streptomyces phage Karp]UTN92432.1 hypothetical protein SEA_STIGMA_208 [Streptomyces phage Stigma]